MKLTQLNPTKENLWELLTREDVYLVRFSESRAKRSEGRREVSPYPTGLSFKNVGKMTVNDLHENLNSGKAIIVELKLEES